MKEQKFSEYLKKKYESDPSLVEGIKREVRLLDIALQIYSLRKSKGLTQKQLARKVNMSQPNIARLESASYHAYSQSTLEKIAKALNADFNVLITPAEETTKILNVVDTFWTTKTEIKSLFKKSSLSYVIYFSSSIAPSCLIPNINLNAVNIKNNQQENNLPTKIIENDYPFQFSII